MGLSSSHRLKRGALVKKGTESFFSQIMTWTLKKKCIYVHAQVIQNCTTLNRVDIYNMDGKQQDVKQRKRKPGKRCVMMFCNKQMQTDSAFTSFLKPWMLDNTSSFCLQLFHGNILQIFIFVHLVRQIQHGKT